MEINAKNKNLKLLKQVFDFFVAYAKNIKMQRLEIWKIHEKMID